MFSNLIKNLFLSFGPLLIGFGIGMTIADNFQIPESPFWLVTLTSLILGGFLTALGVVKKEMIEEETEE